MAESPGGKSEEGLKRPFHCYRVPRPSKMTYPYMRKSDTFIITVKEFTPCPKTCISLNKASLRLFLEIERFSIIAKKGIRLFPAYLLFMVTC